MRIVLDAMGGDAGVRVNVQGALDALREYPDMRLTLVGREEDMRGHLQAITAGGGNEPALDRLTLLHAPDVIGMHEAPVMAVRRKPHSSIVEGLMLVKNGEADAFVSAGSTGAVLAGGMFRVGRIEGVERPALAALFPMRTRKSLILDIGANTDCKPEWLAQFALMGSIYMRRTQGIENPQVALVNIGMEEEKGNETVKRAYQLLKEQPGINFIGNAEARDLPEGVADVLVCDGFVGNVILKFMEGTVHTIFKIVKDGLKSTNRGKVGGLIAKPTFKRIAAGLDASEVGGTPFLGVDGVVIKAHGNSNARAIFSAIRQARLMVENRVVSIIKDGIIQ
ncbi:MAG: phosphate acyltransferase PlsX [Clostridia bacterium]|nr:phosphate acyltransferase PlsX [Clostridia bacterium]